MQYKLVVNYPPNPFETCCMLNSHRNLWWFARFLVLKDVFVLFMLSKSIHRLLSTDNCKEAPLMTWLETNLGFSSQDEFFWMISQENIDTFNFLKQTRLIFPRSFGTNYKNPVSPHLVYSLYLGLKSVFACIDTIGADFQYQRNDKTKKWNCIPIGFMPSYKALELHDFADFNNGYCCGLYLDVFWLTPNTRPTVATIQCRVNQIYYVEYKSIEAAKPRLCFWKCIDITRKALNNAMFQMITHRETRGCNIKKLSAEMFG